MQPLISVISSSQELFQIFFLVSMRIDISWIAFYSVVSLSLSFLKNSVALSRVSGLTVSAYWTIIALWVVKIYT